MNEGRRKGRKEKNRLRKKVRRKAREKKGKEGMKWGKEMHGQKVKVKRENIKKSRNGKKGGN